MRPLGPAPAPAVQHRTMRSSQATVGPCPGVSSANDRGFCAHGQNPGCDPVGCHMPRD